MMRRITSLFLASMIMITALFFGSFAQADEKPVYTGYTEEGVYFEVYEVVTARRDAIKENQDAKWVKIRILYEGKVDPPRQFYYAKEYKKVLYSGNLDLKRVNYCEGETQAYYEGYVRKA